MADNVDKELEFPQYEEMKPLNLGEPSLQINVRGKTSEAFDDAISMVGGFTQIIVHDLDTDKQYVYDKDVFCDLLSEVIRLRDELEEWKARYSKDFEISVNRYKMGVEDSGAKELRETIGLLLDKIEEMRGIAWRPFRKG